jgi:hypothetical protein
MRVQILTAMITGISIMTSAGCATIMPANPMNNPVAAARCEDGEARINISHKKYFGHLQKFPDGTFSTAFTGNGATKVYFYNPAVSNVLITSYRHKGVEAYSTINILGHLVSNETDKQLDNLADVYERVCTKNVTALDERRGEWPEGLDSLDSHIFTVKSDPTGAYTHDPEFRAILQRHIPGLTVDLSKGLASQADWGSEYRISDPHAALVALSDPGKKTALNKELGEYFGSDRFVDAEYLRDIKYTISSGGQAYNGKTRDAAKAARLKSAWEHKNDNGTGPHGCIGAGCGGENYNSKTSDESPFK